LSFQRLWASLRSRARPAARAARAEHAAWAPVPARDGDKVFPSDGCSEQKEASCGGQTENAEDLAVAESDDAVEAKAKRGEHLQNS
jgi:hypothetical protein